MRKFITKPIIFFFFIILIFFILRLFNLSQAINYGSDAARDFLETWNMYMTKHPALIGPPSEYSYNGRQFFFGPAPYYFILPALILGHWDPLAVSYFMIFLNITVLLISLIILSRNVKEKSSVYFFALFCTFAPNAVAYAQSYWNPYFMLPISTLIVALIVKSRMHKSITWIYLLIGFLFGLGLQFHYAFIFAIIVGCAWLFYRKKATLFLSFLLLGGFIIGVSPLIIFELRNHFYNINTIFLILTHQTNARTNFIFNTFYLISLLPFLFYVVSILLVKINKLSYLITYAFFAIYIVWSLFVVFSPHLYPLSYSNAKLIAQKIEQDSPKNFNIADQLTGDNRATPIRYLLTVQGYSPKGVIEYANVSTLYIYSKAPLNALLTNPIWEIKTFLPYAKIKATHVSDNITLYELSK